MLKQDLFVTGFYDLVERLIFHEKPCNIRDETNMNTKQLLPRDNLSAKISFCEICLFIYLLLVSHLGLSQWIDDPVVG